MYDRYTRYQKTCDAVFVLFAITWVVTRLGFTAWPTGPILQVFFEEPQDWFCGTSLSAWPGCFDQLLTRCGVYPTWILYSTLIDAENFVEMFPAYYIFNGLLGTLQLLHILWTYFLFKAIQKALSKGGVDDKRSDSEPSEEEEDENDNQLKKDI